MTPLFSGQPQNEMLCIVIRESVTSPINFSDLKFFFCFTLFVFVLKMIDRPSHIINLLISMVMIERQNIKDLGGIPYNTICGWYTNIFFIDIEIDFQRQVHGYCVIMIVKMLSL